MLKVLGYFGNASSQDKLGNLYFKQGKKKESAQWYLKASKTNLHAKVGAILAAFQINGAYPIDCAEGYRRT